MRQRQLDIDQPLISMSGFKLGFGLAVLVQELFEGSEYLSKSSPNETDARDKEDLFNDTAFLAGSILPKRRALIIRYATLVVAQEFPDAVVTLTEQYDASFANDLGDSLIGLATEIERLCSVLYKVDDDRYPQRMLSKLDEVLARHARLTEDLYQKFFQKAQACSLLS